MVSRALGAAALLGGLVTGAAAQAPESPPAGVAASDSAVVDGSAVAADSLEGTALADSAEVAAELPPWRPGPTRAALRSFRLERSVDVRRATFGDVDDPASPTGMQTLAEWLRLQPTTHTRELSQGPTVSSFGVDGAGSGRTALQLRGHGVPLPGTSGPHAHEVMLSEIGSLAFLSGGAAALYGPDAISGALLVEPAHPLTDELHTRAVAEEGVDDYQRAGFQAAHRLGHSGSFFLASESRRVDGFFPGTKEVDRHFTASVQRALPRGFEVAAGYRRFEGDGRHGDFEDPVSALTKRGDWHAEVFRSLGEDRGALFDVNVRRERLETNVGTAELRTREVVAPRYRLTMDLPDWRGWNWTTRAEGTRWRIEDEEAGSVDLFWRAALAVRASRQVAPDVRVTGTARFDSESHRKRAIQARAEGEWRRGAAALFGIYARGERIPDRGAEGSENEVHDTGTVGVRWDGVAVRARATAFATNVRDARRDPTFEELRSRSPVLDAPVGQLSLRGATLGAETAPFQVPGVRFLGHWNLATSVGALHAENDDTGERLPGRPRFTWTGEGFLERRFFQDELLARLRGRLTHWRDRVDEAGEPVVDLWTTDVLLEGEIGDAVFFYRFHDLLERADEIEPGIRFPGFSRMYGVSWRFVG